MPQKKEKPYFVLDDTMLQKDYRDPKSKPKSKKRKPKK